MHPSADDSVAPLAYPLACWWLRCVITTLGAFQERMAYEAIEWVGRPRNVADIWLTTGLSWMQRHRRSGTSLAFGLGHTVWSSGPLAFEECASHTVLGSSRVYPWIGRPGGLEYLGGSSQLVAFPLGWTYSAVGFRLDELSDDVLDSKVTASAVSVA